MTEIDSVYTSEALARVRAAELEATTQDDIRVTNHEIKRP